MATAIIRGTPSFAPSRPRITSQLTGTQTYAGVATVISPFETNIPPLAPQIQGLRRNARTALTVILPCVVGATDVRLAQTLPMPSKGNGLRQGQVQTAPARRAYDIPNP